MAKIPERDHDHHDWHSRDYVSKWAEGQDRKEADRKEQFALMAQTIPYEKNFPLGILDVGAGYGALTRFLLGRFPNAAAVCLDHSAEMARLGAARMENFKGRFAYAHADVRKPGWSRKAKGPFEAVVSSIAIHNVRAPGVIRAVYREIFPLVKTGGCFLNLDWLAHPLEDHLEWLRESGFAAVRAFWTDEDRKALFGGFRK